MKDNRNPLAAAIRYALGAGVVAGLAATAAPVLAQDNGEESASLDRVQVTGSRIRRTDIENTSPVTVVTREQILSSGYGNIGDVLRNLSQADSLGLTNLTSSTNANDGTQTVSLRGLGASRTLVLVDGRRWLSLGGGAVDLTQIPNAIIERVEVLADGASAIYGSDAIAGVINIILRDDFQGMEVDAFYGENGEGDGELRQYGVSFGHRTDRGNLFFNINKVEQEKISAGDRAITETPVQFVPQAFGSAFGRFGIFFVPGVGNRSLNPSFDQSSGQPTPADFVPFGTPVRFNFAPTNFLLTPSDRINALVRGTYDLTDSLKVFDDIRFFGNFSFNQRESVTQIAPVPIVAGFSGPQWEIPFSGDSVFNPFGVDLPAWGFRMPGNRTNIQDFDTYFTTLGFEGSQTIAGRVVDWDLSYSRGQSSRNEVGLNFVNLLRLAQGVGPSFIDPNSGQAVCGTPDAPTPFLNGRTCVPLNFFNGLTGLTPEMLDFVSQSLVQREVLEMREWQFNIATELFELPAGPVGFAAGYERRTNGFSDKPDSTILAGINSTNFREPTDGEQMAEEYYFEVAVPLLRDLPMIEYLEVTGAGRISDFSNRGLVGNNQVNRSFDNESFKVGLLYRPFSDLVFRANYSETFRAPPAGTLFAGGGEGFPAGIDPCTNADFAGNPFAGLTPEQQARCLASGVPAGGAPQATSQIRSLNGGNSGLEPEEGDTKTIGFVYNPSWLNGFDVAIDFWDVQLDDALSNRGIGAILNGCIRDGDPTDCTFIERNPATGEVATVRTAPFNLASIRIKGYDGSANYRLNTESFGTFAFGLNATYTSSAKLTLGPLSEADSVVGDMVGAFGGPTWRWRGTGSVAWRYGDFGVTWGMRYLHHLEEDCAGLEGFLEAGLSTRQLCSNPNFDDPDRDATNKIGAVTYHDLSASYEVPWNGTVRAGVRNLFDKDPPFNVSSFANSFDQAYDIPGQFWWLSYQQRF